MIDEYGSPSTGSKALAGLIVGGCLLWLAPTLGDWWEMLVALVGTVILLAGALQGVLWVVMRWLQVAAWRQEVKANTPALRLLEAAHSLTDEQRAILPGLDYKVIEVDVLASDKSLFFYLVTPDGRIPFSWLRGFLDDCGVTELRAVRTYSEGTAGYEHVRSFTAWAVRYGYALPSAGNQPAQWVDEDTRDRLKERFGFPSLELDDTSWSGGRSTMTIIPEAHGD